MPPIGSECCGQKDKVTGYGSTVLHCHLLLHDLSAFLTSFFVAISFSPQSKRRRKP